MEKKFAIGAIVVLLAMIALFVCMSMFSSCGAVENEPPGEIGSPTLPVEPTEPDAPDTPSFPTEPESEEPDIPPTEPEKPDEPDIPPTEPEKPETPTEPEQPDEPEKPTEPDTPDEPEKPIEPEQPVRYYYRFEAAGKSSKTYEQDAGGEISGVPTDFDYAVPHYEFIGWTAEGRSVVFPFTPTSEETVFIAEYTPVVYRITYENVSDNCGNPTEYTVESDITFVSPSKDGYEFVGWFTDPEFASVFDATRGGDAVLYASWKHVAHCYSEEHVCIVCGVGHAVSEHDYGNDYLCTICGKEDENRPWNGTEKLEPRGTGTEADPYLISSGAELKYISDKINGAVGTYASAYYLLSADIDLGGHIFVPIGFCEDLAFKGTFDGNGFSVKNAEILCVAENVSVPEYYVGLFGVVLGGEIKNLNTEDISVTVSGDGAYNIGVLAGMISGGTRISDCHVVGSVNATGSAVRAGGAIGIARGDRSARPSVSGCIASGSVTVKSRGNLAVAGGFIGAADNADISLSGSYASAVAEDGAQAVYAGGFVGYVGSDYTPHSVKDCFAAGDVSSSHIAGGFASFAGDNTILLYAFYDCKFSSSQSVLAGGEKYETEEYDGMIEKVSPDSFDKE